MKQLLLYITKITASIIKMYVNLHDHVMIMDYLQENGAWIMLAHPMTYGTLNSWNGMKKYNEKKQIFTGIFVTFF